MARTRQRQDEKGVIELLEEAVHAVRLAPAGCWGAYYVGSLPFVLAVLYFWADMSRSAFAKHHVVEASMGLAVLFVWMKCWQSVFMQKLLAGLSGGPAPRWPLRRAARLVITQAVIQPWGLFVLTLSALAIIPFPWAYALWQNACLLGDGRAESTVRRTLRAAWHQATVWAAQNMLVLLVLLFFGLLVSVNIAQAILFPSWLLKTFLGVETLFSRGGFSVLNTTFLAVTLGLTYLCVDPLAKAFYTLRCFYGRSRRTGEDLQAELKHLVSAKTASIAGLLAVAVALAACASPAAAEPRRVPRLRCLQPCPTLTRLHTPQPWHPSGTSPLRLGALAASHSPEPSAAPAGGGVAPDELDESVRRVISRREYVWRMPREEDQADQAESFLGSALRKLNEWVEALFDRLFRERERKQEPREAPMRPAPEPSGGGWVNVMQPIIYVLLGVGVVVLGVLLWQAYRQRRRGAAKEADESAAATPDLADEDVTADDLPEKDWLDLAREMLAKGDRRLALRAMYLASLALLAERDMIAIARFKSNGDYRAELQRRAHAVPDLVGAFAGNVDYFEDAWYGMHEVTDGIVRGFVANQKRIRSSGEA